MEPIYVEEQTDINAYFTSAQAREGGEGDMPLKNTS